MERSDMDGTTQSLETAGLEDQRNSVEQIYESLLNAMLEHRLPAGTKLGEERLAELTGATRSRIRQVLARLAHEQLVTLIPNRGAFVASPTPEEAQHVLQTRRFVEPEMAAVLASKPSPRSLAELRAHLQQEEDARTRSDREAMIRLSGEFHVLMARMAGNPILEKLVTEMVSRTCLIITLYDRPLAHTCPDHEHQDLLASIEAGDPESARRIMAHHLKHVEDALDLHSVARREVSLESIFSGFARM
jgi:DNA-binding GntR family transcriptional regulator